MKSTTLKDDIAFALICFLVSSALLMTIYQSVAAKSRVTAVDSRTPNSAGDQFAPVATALLNTEGTSGPKGCGCPSCCAAAS